MRQVLQIMTVRPRSLTDVSNGPTEAEAIYAVLDTALDAARFEPDDPFPEWRVRTLRTARSKFAELCEQSPVPRPLEPEHVGTTLDVCSGLSPTPHERIEYMAEYDTDERHPNEVFGEIGTALRPFYGNAIPEAPVEDEEDEV